MIPGLAVVWVILFVLLLAIVLDRLLFKPLARVMREREQAVRSATELAEAAASKARAATEEFENRTRAVQAEVYREMDERRRAALDKRSEVLATTRREVEAQVADATARLDADAAAARARLERDADALAGEVAERILGRKVS